MKNIKFLAIPALMATLVSCVNGDDYGTPDTSSECTTLPVTKQVAAITALASSNNPVEYLDPVDADGNPTEIGVMEAYVTSSDEGGNFYKSISFVSTDGAKGFSIPVDNYNLYTKYEPGRKVFIRLNKLHYSYTTQTSTHEFGNLYNGNQIGRLSGVDYQNFLVRGCDDQKIDEEQLVNHMTIAEAKNNNNLHKLIEFDNVQFTDLSLGKNFFDASMNPSPTWTATNHIVTDAEGNTIILRASQFAIFANQKIPSGNGKIRGVLTKYNNDFQFMIRTINDVQLDNTRLHPTIENFESYPSSTATFSNYFNIKVQGTNDWFVGSFNGNKYLQARKGSSSAATEIYFVMPFDFDTHTKVSFQTLYGYMSQTTSPIMKVYYSTNFDSSNPTANLVDITNSFMFSNHTGTGWASAFTSSGIHTFTGMSGQGHIIFAYDVSTPSNTTAESRPGVQIDNILFQ